MYYFQERLSLCLFLFGCGLTRALIRRGVKTPCQDCSEWKIISDWPILKIWMSDFLSPIFCVTIYSINRVIWALAILWRGINPSYFIAFVFSITWFRFLNCVFCFVILFLSLIFITFLKLRMYFNDIVLVKMAFIPLNCILLILSFIASAFWNLYLWYLLGVGRHDGATNVFVKHLKAGFYSASWRQRVDVLWGNQKFTCSSTFRREFSFRRSDKLLNTW